MSEQIKHATRQIFESIEDNRQLTGYYRNLRIPPIERGKENQSLSIGDKVKAGPTCQYRNVTGTIIECYNNNGYIRYIVKWNEFKSTSDCRQSDLIKI